MKKLFIFIFAVLIGFGLLLSNSKAEEGRALRHSFKAFTTSTAVPQSKVIYRITGVATGSSAVFGIYNVATLGAASTSNVAVEGGEATSGDPLPNMYFGPDGLILDSGSTVIVSNCTIVVEYI